MSYRKSAVPDESKAASNQDLCRKQLVLTDRTRSRTKSAPRHPAIVPQCKSYIEMADGTLVDEEEFEAVQMIAELIKSITELAKVL